MTACYLRYVVDPHKLGDQGHFAALDIDKRNRSVINYERSFFRPMLP